MYSSIKKDKPKRLLKTEVFNIEIAATKKP
jgi:hypothetical protein